MTSIMFGGGGPGLLERLLLTLQVTPLYLAAQGGHLDIVKALVMAGADPGIRAEVKT